MITICHTTNYYKDYLEGEIGAYRVARRCQFQYTTYSNRGLSFLKGRPRNIAPFIPLKIENSTCEIASAALGTLFLCCVRVVYQNTRALLLLLFCYLYET